MQVMQAKCNFIYASAAHAKLSHQSIMVSDSLETLYQHREPIKRSAISIRKLGFMTRKNMTLYQQKA